MDGKPCNSHGLSSYSEPIVGHQVLSDAKARYNGKATAQLQEALGHDNNIPKTESFLGMSAITERQNVFSDGYSESRFLASQSTLT